MEKEQLYIFNVYSVVCEKDQIKQRAKDRHNIDAIAAIARENKKNVWDVFKTQKDLDTYKNFYSEFLETEQPEIIYF